jgi:hypothetical protein
MDVLTVTKPNSIIHNYKVKWCKQWRWRYYGLALEAGDDDYYRTHCLGGIIRVMQRGHDRRRAE